MKIYWIGRRNSQISWECSMLPSLTVSSLRTLLLSCGSPKRLCKAFKFPSSSFSSPQCSGSCSSNPSTTPSPGPTSAALFLLFWSAGQAWPAYNSLIGALISPMRARGSSWLQMKWIWFGPWLQAKHLLRPGEVIEGETVVGKGGGQSGIVSNGRAGPYATFA